MNSQPYEIVNDIITTLANGNISHNKSALLTLHFLFPHDFLPALDILDRHLVTRLVICDELVSLPQNEVYCVQSALAASSRTTKTSRHHIATPTAYEVRLAAWNCTCPAFAYSTFGRTFQNILNLNEPSTSHAKQLPDAANVKARLGGLLTATDAGMPVCKHILAAFLGTVAPDLFGRGVSTKVVDRNEAAGWAGGWGD